jgi:hypothetical protein
VKKEIKMIIKVNMLVACLVTTVALSACNVEKLDTNKSLAPWTKEEIDNLFSLEEVGKLTQDENGNYFLANRPLDMSYVTTQTIGTSHPGSYYNILNLDAETLNYIADHSSNETMNFFLFASPKEMRSMMNRYKIHMPDVQAALSKDGTVNLTEFSSLATRAFEKTQDKSLLQNLGVNLESH